MKTLLLITVLVLAASPAVAKKYPQQHIEDDGWCARQITQTRRDDEGRSHAKFFEQMLSDCLTQHGF